MYLQKHSCCKANEHANADLELSAFGSNDGIDRNEEQHHHKPGKDGEAHGEIEEDQSKHYLKRGGPDHVEVAHEVHEALGVHRHEVHYLSHRPLLAGSVAETQGLVATTIHTYTHGKCT